MQATSPLKCLAVLLAATLTSHAFACTGLSIRSNDGGIVAGRTLEFGEDPQSSISVVPAGTEFTGTVPDGKGLKFKAKYGFTGANGFGVKDTIIDGFNEKGLYVGMFYFPGYAQYMEGTPENNARGLAPWEFPTWVLATCSTVAEVKAALSNIAVVPTFLAALKEVPGAHYKIQDAEGNCIVIEPSGGKLCVYDNPIWVFTNSPEFPWHLRNLNNYLDLSSAYPEARSIGGVKLAPFGMGGGLVGMPGDFTPPSRFVRMAIYLHNLPKQATTEDSVRIGFHLLNNFDLPPGSNKPPAGTSESLSDYTPWTSISDLKNLIFHCKTYHDQNIQSVNLKKALSKAGSKPMIIPMGDQSHPVEGT